MTGARNEAAFVREGEEARIEADQVAIVFGDCSSQIVEPDLTAGAREELESVDVTASESLESLAMSELQIHFAAVRFDQAEGVRGAVVNQRAEVAPVHIEPFAGRRFDADVSAAGNGVLAKRAQVILDDGEAAVVSMRLQPLGDHGGVGIRVLLEQFSNDFLEWIELAGAIAVSGFRSRRFQILGNRAAAATRDDAWVFPSERMTPLSKDNCWRREMFPALAKVGLGWANFLVMRRTHATLMKASGVDGKLVADQLGHSLDVNQNVYTQSPVESRLGMVNQLEKSLLVM